MDKRWAWLLAAAAVLGLNGCSDDRIALPDCVGEACDEGCDKCSAGEWKCTATGYRACVPKNGCLVWSDVQPCDAGKVCHAEQRQCVEEIPGKEDPVTCDNACVWGETRCEDDLVRHCETQENGCRAWSAAVSCGSGLICDADTGTCVEGCRDKCTEGAKRCDGARVQTCVKDEFSECMIWSMPESCEGDAHCDEATGTCEAGCVDECTEGQTECVDDDIRMCGQFDDDACLEFGELTGCTSGSCDATTNRCAEADCDSACELGMTICSPDSGEVWVCQQNPEMKCPDYVMLKQCLGDLVCRSDDGGADCVTPKPDVEIVCTPGEKRCSADAKGVEMCVENDAGNAWQTSPCAGTQFCNGGACMDTCQNACTEGAKRCASEKKAQVCQKTASGCTDWVETSTCSATQHCNAGSCEFYCGDDCDPWSIVIIPDTQNYTRHDSVSSSTPYHKQMNWIVKNKDTALIPNLKMVIHMGDITEKNENIQWKIALDAQNILKKAKIPFTVVNGNHDYKVAGGIGGRSKSKFSNYFTESYLKSLPGYGGIYKNHNTYFNFKAGNQEYMVLNLEYYPRQQVLCWANNLLKKAENANKKVIVATHANLTHKTTTKPDNYYSGHSKVIDVAHGASGSELWNFFSSRHSNILMVLSGHVGDSERLEKKGNNGNIVEQILTDYQFEAPCNAAKLSQCTSHCSHIPDAGNGWLRVVTFYPKTNKVKVTTTTVLSGSKSVFSQQGSNQFFCSSLYKGTENKNWYSKDPANAVHQYEFSFDFTTPKKNAYKDNGNLAFARRNINNNGDGTQLHSSVAVLPNGKFITVWEDDSSSADGLQSDKKTNAHDIYGRIMNPQGCEISGNSEIIINAETAGHQADPDVAADKDGNFVVVWTDDKDNNGSTQVYMRGFDAEGKQRFATKVVNKESTRDQYQARIAMAPDGQFAVSWTDKRASESMPQIYVRGFKANGTEAFAERLITDKAEGTRVKSDIFMDKDHRVIVAWQDDGDGNGSTQVKFRILNADGTNKTSAKTANSVSKGDQNAPSISGKQDGSKFLIAWSDVASSSATTYNIMARTFDANGNPIDADFTASTSKTKNQDVQVCMNNSGNALLTWYDPTSRNVKYRKFKDGKLSDAEGRINQPDNTDSSGKNGKSYQPAVSCLPDGKLSVVTYSDDRDNNGYNEIFGYGLNI